MIDKQSIGKDNQGTETTLISRSTALGCNEAPKPSFTEYMIEGTKLVTTKVYLNRNDEELISNFCLNDRAVGPLSYEEELMDEFLKIGHKYEPVNYPAMEVLEGDGKYDCQGDNDEDFQNSSSEDNQMRPSLEDYDFSDQYTQNDYDSEVDLDVYNMGTKDFHSERENVKDAEDISSQGVAIDHDLSEGFTSKAYPLYKDEPYLGRGLDSDIPRHEQPREKALRLGIDALSDAELLALIFGTGIKGQNVLEMSRQILRDNMNHLSLLACLSPQELTMRYKGIGQAKAITLCAAMALGIRAERDAHSNQLKQINSSLKAYNLLRPKLQWIEHEEFWVIFLTKSNNLKNCCCISRGGISETVVDVRIVIQRALQESASSMILVHNHPGSLLVPSEQDDQLTTKIMEAARFFDIKVLDHIIIGASGYYSFKEHNHMRF